MVSQQTTYRMIKPHLWWWEGRLVCLVCSAIDGKPDTIFSTRPRTRRGAARFIRQHSSCGLF